MKKYLKLLILIAWMSLIFFFSAQPQLESEETSNLVAELIYRIYALIMAGSAHLGQSEFMALYIQPIRKLAHFSEFMILGILVYINVLEYRKDKLFTASLVISILYAMSDEFHQLFVENRYCSIKDILIDSAGAILGITICHLINKRWKKSH